MRSFPAKQTPTANNTDHELPSSRLLQRFQVRSRRDVEGGVPPIVPDVLRTPGQPIDSVTRSFMEPRFGHDFSGVNVQTRKSTPAPARLAINAPKDTSEQEAEKTAERVTSHPSATSNKVFDFSGVRLHTDAKAGESARAIGALAYTVGQNIVFGYGQYTPQTSAGRKLLAHELTHVIQQTQREEPMLIQRAVIEGCTETQTATIQQAVTQASADVTTILPTVSQRPVRANVRNALWMAFRDDSDSTADLALNNIRRLQNQMNTMRYVCRDRDSDSDCGDKNLAYTHLGAFQEPVRICRPAFFDNEQTAINQAQTIVHENAHAFLSMDDRGYFSHPTNLCSETTRPADVPDPANARSGTAGDNPGLRLENADAYACFVYFLRYRTPENLQTQASAYRGEGLRIEPVDDLLSGELYTRPTTPQLHRFGISGLPENSGFRFRWRVEAGSTRYNPTSIGGSSAGAFAEDNSQIYFPTMLLNLLEQNGVRQVTLVCEITLYSSLDRGRFVAPIITKTLRLNIIFDHPPVDF